MADLPPNAPKDPIVTSSFSTPLMICSVLLMITVAWSLWDEMYGLRPWRAYQRRFATAYSKYLDKEVGRQKKLESDVYSSPDYKKLAAEADALESAAKAKDDTIAQQIALLDSQRAAIGDAFKDARGKIGHLVYMYEIVPAKDKSEKESRLKDLNEAKAGTWKVDWPTANGGIEKDKKFTADQLNDTFTNLMAERAKLVAARGDNDAAGKVARAKANVYLSDHLPGLSSAALEGLLNSARDWDETLIQINVNPSGASINNLGGAGLVDRCQSCHIGMDPIVRPAAANAHQSRSRHGQEQRRSIHQPSRSRSNQNSPARKVSAARPVMAAMAAPSIPWTSGHGRYEHWLWPLYYPENYDAGCQQCHAADMVTEHAPVLNHGQASFTARSGCIGCHRFQGFDNQDEQLVSARQQIPQLDSDKNAGRTRNPAPATSWATTLPTTTRQIASTRKPPI